MVVDGTVAHVVLYSMDFGDAQLCSHHHVHQETDLRGSQGHISGMSHDRWLRTLVGDARGVSGHADPTRSLAIWQ